MPSLTIAWEYLTGYSVATDPASRRRPEWPPHPGRVFMALAAAWFETGQDPDEGIALRWLECLGDPSLVMPSGNDVFPRKVVEVYVPVNDRADPYDWPDKKKKATIHSQLGSVAIGRSRQPRTFPCIRVGESICFLHWPHAAGVETHRSALDGLCGKVTRIGHSSSLVRMWVAEEIQASHRMETWAPEDGLADLRARRISEGTLGILDELFNQQARNQYDRLGMQIKILETNKRMIRGRGAAPQKTIIQEEIETLRAERDSLDSRPPLRPKIGLWSGYRKVEPQQSREASHTQFDSDLLILKQIDGPRLPSVSTLAVTKALRGAIMSHVHAVRCGCSRWANQELNPVGAPECYAKIPAWVSGHSENAEPLRDSGQHLAVIPLAFVGGEFADGHLVGAALVFPRVVARSERGRVIGQFILAPTGEPRVIELTLGALGVWKLVKREWSESRHALKPEHWTAQPTGSTAWASVTPVVLDRFPSSNLLKEPAEWQGEVAEIVATACQRIGLPVPNEIHVGTTSWQRGSPRSLPKRRVLRGHVGVVEAAMGDGFPPYPARGTNGPRLQVHVCLRFLEPVIGPILLGAGRFLGYGLCKPLWKGANR